MGLDPSLRWDPCHLGHRLRHAGAGKGAVCRKKAKIFRKMAFTL